MAIIFCLKMLHVIINSKRFVSVNAQINSSTHGYNNIKKYTNANAVIINETELRQELRDNICRLKIFI